MINGLSKIDRKIRIVFAENLFKYLTIIRPIVHQIKIHQPWQGNKLIVLFRKERISTHIFGAMTLRYLVKARSSLRRLIKKVRGNFFIDNNLDGIRTQPLH